MQTMCLITHFEFGGQRSVKVTRDKTRKSAAFFRSGPRTLRAVYVWENIVCQCYADEKISACCPVSAMHARYEARQRHGPSEKQTCTGNCK